MQELPGDCQRLIWKKLYDECLKDIMMEATIRLKLMFISWGDENDDMSYAYFDLYDDAMLLNGYNDDDIDNQISNDDRHCGNVGRLLDMVEGEYKNVSVLSAITDR